MAHDEQNPRPHIATWPHGHRNPTTQNSIWNHGHVDLKPMATWSETHSHADLKPRPNRSWERENPHHERKRGESVRQRGEKIEERGIWKVRGRETVWEIKKLIFFYKLMNSKSIRISLAKFFGLFYNKNLLFLFYATIFPKHTHQFIYFTIYSI